jgi:hypothetical protein
MERISSDRKGSPRKLPGFLASRGRTLSRNPIQFGMGFAGCQGEVLGSCLAEPPERQFPIGARSSVLPGSKLDGFRFVPTSSDARAMAWRRLTRECVGTVRCMPDRRKGTGPIGR